MQIADLMMNEVDTQIRECATLLRDAPEGRTKKHMLAFTRLLGLGSMLAYYLAHQPDAMMPAQRIDGGVRHELLDIPDCVKVCEAISSSIESKRPVDTVRVNQVFLDVCTMMGSVKAYIPSRILHIQPSAGEAIVKDSLFESNMAELIKNVGLARQAQNLMCTETMPCTSAMPVRSPEALDSPGILSQYFPGCGALGAPATPTTPAAKRSLLWGTPDVDTDDVRDIEGNADGDTEDDGMTADGMFVAVRNLKRSRTECK